MTTFMRAYSSISSWDSYSTCGSFYFLKEMGYSLESKAWRKWVSTEYLWKWKSHYLPTKRKLWLGHSSAYQSTTQGEKKYECNLPQKFGDCLEKMQWWTHACGSLACLSSSSPCDQYSFPLCVYEWAKLMSLPMCCHPLVRLSRTKIEPAMHQRQKAYLRSKYKLFKDSIDIL